MSGDWIYRSGVLSEHGSRGYDPRILAMKRSTDTQPQLPVHDYGLALQRAVSWLGDRYLLAAPVERSVSLPALRQVRHRFLTRPLTAPARLGTDPAVLVH